MIELHIAHTGKGYSPKAKWTLIHEETLPFPTIEAAEAWIRETYGKSKRHSMMRDLPDGKAERIGYVIGYRNADLSHVPVDRWIARDWIEFRRCERIAV